MKKLTVLAVLAALAVFPAFGNTSGDLELTGNITPFLSIALSESSINLFDISDVGLTEAQSGSGSVTVTERSNRFAGYTVTVASQNTWKLANERYDAESPDEDFLLPYTFTYAGSSGWDLSNAEVIITNSNSRTAGNGIQKVFAVSVEVPALAPEGEYSDEITFTIAAK